MDQNYNNCEIDYKASYEAMLKFLFGIERLGIRDGEYFEHLAEVNSFTKDINIVANHLADMDRPDQVALLRLLICQGELCKVLREKYGFEEGV